MSSATLYKWRAKYGGMDTSMMTCMKAIESENSQLEKIDSENRRKAEILKGSH